ncbi:hypothetical protein K503DRAFT_824140 [Rhizopogon vinicolor AM-OR11-026]|uniref:Heterokaryon incompatibility domain-containing protein n=1 Tax=Rhizopogon vinicolor AM-OR11-026 TaxID=1314800 RepID=A0A1B7MVU2_9AGAM|nr:hypothetical protein K503DRAFT_824140 [Rhizopogon vinicolor AM-OR11-026]
MPNPPSRIVKYAILSHRWLDEGEPTYEEMKSGTKLEKFCEKALEYDVEFAWSDTCCIDKNSSTELDESIRSMFRWYANSHICITHLAQSETIEDIMDDEWAERGWTLQELLAPGRIRLATDIPHDALYGIAPARCKTTRVEDVAYSLMGIFDVTLQISYGEGGDRAFCRPIEAITQAGDPSVLNWRGQAAEHHSSNAIPRSPQNFVGRTLGFPPDPSREPLEMTMTSLGLRCL